MSTLAIIGLVLLVIGVIMALAWERTPGITLAIVGAVIFLVALFTGDGIATTALLVPMLLRTRNLKLL